MTNISERERRLQALEAELAQLTDYARRWYQPAPITERDLAQKREARLYREAFESLSEQERAEFEKEFGLSATIKRLAEEARRQADAAWERQLAERLNTEYQTGMWEGVQFRNELPSANMDKLLEQQERFEQAKRERLEARAKRELAAEVHDEELPRVLATFDAEELAIFNRLMERVPTQLEALEQFRQAKAHNPLEGVNDSAELYGMAFSSRGVNPEALPADISKVADSTTLYEIALKNVLEG